MKAKKNPKHDLRRNSTLYFLIGLTTVLCMGYTVIEWKSYDTEQVYDDILEKPDYLIAELPPVIQPPEPPKPKLIPSVIEVVPDISDEPESVIDIPEVDQTTEVVPIKHIIIPPNIRTVS